MNELNRGCIHESNEAEIQGFFFILLMEICGSKLMQISAYVIK